MLGLRRCAAVLGLVVAGGACGGGGSGPSIASGHPRIYLGADKDRLTAALTSDAGTRFQGVVDGWVGGSNIYGFEPWNAALLGQLTNDPKYCMAAAAAVDMTVQTAEAAIAAGNAPAVAADDYLPIGDTVGNLALVYDWCQAAIPSGRASAWLAFANQAVQNVWAPTTASWGGKAMAWDGWAIDDPSDNYYYSFLRATMLLGLAEKGDDPMGDTWITQFHDTKIVGELDPKFSSDLVGGGSREGTGYGVAMRGLWELYDQWNASTGEDLATLTPQTKASLLAMIHSIVPTLDRLAPIGDQSRDSTAAFFDYHRNYIAELVSLYPDDPAAAPAMALLAASSVPEMTEQFMYAYDFLYANANVTPTQLTGLGTSYYAPGTGEIYARSGWDTHATWINMIAGPYTESHAHQDQGSLMIYKDGWLAYDAGVQSHSGLRQEVGAHGTVRLLDGSGNAIPQKTGNASNVMALHRGDTWLHVAADLTPVYGGQSAVSSIQREIVYLQPSCIVVYDRVTSTTQQAWSLAFPAMPTLAGTQTSFTGSGHTLAIQRVTPATGVTASAYDYTADSDYSGGYRLDEVLPAGDQRWLHVIYIDDAVSAISEHDANTVDLTLADGTPVEVGFSPSAIGGTLTINGTATTLGAGVDTLPE